VFTRIEVPSGAGTWQGGIDFGKKGNWSGGFLGRAIRGRDWFQRPASYQSVSHTTSYGDIDATVSTVTFFLSRLQRSFYLVSSIN